MEFEPDAPITDEDRQRAQIKKVTVQPADPFLKPTDLPNPITLNETHPNIAPESEDTAAASELVQPSAGTLTQSSKPFHHTTAFKVLAISFSLLIGLGAGIGYFFLFG